MFRIIIFGLPTQTKKRKKEQVDIEDLTLELKESLLPIKGLDLTTNNLIKINCFFPQDHLFFFEDSKPIIFFLARPELNELTKTTKKDIASKLVGVIQKNYPKVNSVECLILDFIPSQWIFSYEL